MTPGFSLRRIFNRRRYFYARGRPRPAASSRPVHRLLGVDRRLGETPGMREQLAQQGWVGTEITTGSDARHIAVSSLFDEIPPLGLFPSTAPRNVKRTRQENTPILIAARSCSVAGRPASEVWCFDTRVSQRNTPTTKEDVGHYLQDLAVTLQLDELLLAQPELLFEGDLPTDHLFAGRNVIAMRQAAKKESRRGR